ncbi:hypothetical protein D9M72_547570 [compost metagenome]
MAGIDLAFHMAGDIVDAVQISDGGSAEFHHDACHVPLPVPNLARAGARDRKAPAGARRSKSLGDFSDIGSHRFGERKVAASLSGSGGGTQWQADTDSDRAVHHDRCISQQYCPGQEFTETSVPIDPAMPR